MTAGIDGDRGVATVWAAGAIAVLVSMAVFGVYLGEAVVIRHQAESAADLAALAGAAQAIAGEQYACTQARRVTDRMRVQLVACRTRGWDVLVDVAVRADGWLGGLGAATARARAGPVASVLRDGGDHAAMATATARVEAVASGLPRQTAATQAGRGPRHRDTKDEEAGARPLSGSDRWLVGNNQRNMGSLHQDVWEGTGAELAVLWPRRSREADSSS